MKTFGPFCSDFVSSGDVDLISSSAGGNPALPAQFVEQVSSATPTHPHPWFAFYL